ncbi:hypothetical protein [Bathymodiolus heckerae thiotrophic gill symbiont]|uniref:hypothetical protein n=1 Tax=Bathymodiolus heckerae thiotrophic gill symbiont TaxID=1052212 RepID=UPI0010FCDF8B|nr:hypothetical protein [Bathymodiolus heckerae thiotrophic gill symbiont]
MLLLLSSSALALKPHTAIYTILHTGTGVEVATERRVLSKEDGVYHYNATARPSGLGALFASGYKIDAKSSFIINKAALVSVHFQYLERNDDKVKKDYDIYPKDQQIDQLGLFLAFTNALERNPNQTDFYFTVHDGKKAEKNHYQQVSNKDKNLIKIIDSKYMEAYFAKDKYYLPVLVKLKNIIYELTSVQFQ